MIAVHVKLLGRLNTVVLGGGGIDSRSSSNADDGDDGHDGSNSDGGCDDGRGADDDHSDDFGGFEVMLVVVELRKR